MTPRDQTVNSYCIMCYMRCPVICSVSNGRLHRVKPDNDHPLGGTFCIKGAAAPEFVYDPARLKYPMKRTNPKTAQDPGWKRISWEEALDTITQEMLAARARHGAESVAFYRPAPGGSPARDFNPWMLRLANSFGTPNTARTTHICNWHKDSGSAYTYGVGIPEADYENANAILIWGTNPHATAVRHVSPIKHAINRGAKLVVIDPRPIPLTRQADLWLRVRPGSDLPLALGLIRQMIDHQLYDADFLTRWTNSAFLIRDDTDRPLLESDIDPEGSAKRYVVWDEASAGTTVYDPERVAFQSTTVRPLLAGERPISLHDGQQVSCRTAFTRLKEIVSPFTLDRTAEMTSVPREKIAQAARIIGSFHPICYNTYNGLEQHTDAMQTNRAVCILYTLTGDFDRKGGMVVYPKLPVRSMLGTDLLPPDAAKKRLGVDKRPLGPIAREGAVQAYEVYEAITTGRPYPVKALISFGGNLIVSNGDTRKGAQALQELHFYAHMDCYENPTSRFADILLPAASAWECEALGPHNWREKGHVQLRRKVVEPEFERRSDIEVIFELARRLGLGEVFFDGNMEAAFDDMLAPLAMTTSQLREMPQGLSIPLQPTYQKYRLANSAAARPNGFNTPSHLIEVYSLVFAEYGYDPLPRYVEQPERRVDPHRFPLLLTASKPGAFTHGSYRSIPSLRKQIPDPCLEINPAAADARGIRDGDWVVLETPVGSVRLRARFEEEMDPGVVAGQEGWWQGCEPLDLPGYDAFSETGANLNLAIRNDLIDPITGSVPHRGQPCQVTKLHAS